MKMWVLAALAVVGGLVAVSGPAAADEICTYDLETGVVVCVPLAPSPPAPPTTPAVDTPEENPPPPQIHRPPKPPATGPSVDRRSCVSKREFRGAKRGQTRLETEQRWDVVGLGRLREIVGFGRAIVYPRCAFTADEAFYGATYESGRLVVLVEMKNLGAQPHGRP